MAKTLAEKIREARNIEIKVGDITFNATRATVEEMHEIARNMIHDPEISRKHVTGWSGVKESDLIDGGSDELIPFSKELFDEVISDNQEWWTFIAEAVSAKAIERAKNKESGKKK